MTKPNPYGPKGWIPDRIGDLTGKTYLITGANVGAGYEAAKIFLSKGAAVVMLNRSVSKSEAAIAGLKTELGADIKVRFIPMDLANLSSVRAAAERVNAEVPQIDAFIQNAAIAQVATQQFTKDGFECQLGTNHYGHFLLTSLIFSRLVDSKARIVVVGSNAYRMGLKRIQFEDLNFDKNYSAWNAYAQSKLAQMMFAYELQRRVKATGKNVQVHVCHPGASRTSLIRENASPVMRILAALLSPLAQSAERGSWPEVMCATEDGLEPEKLFGPTKRGEMTGPVGECVLEPHVLDAAQAQKLWNVSEEQTGAEWSLPAGIRNAERKAA